MPCRAEVGRLRGAHTHVPEPEGQTACSADLPSAPSKMNDNGVLVLWVVKLRLRGGMFQVQGDKPRGCVPHLGRTPTQPLPHPPSQGP